MSRKIERVFRDRPLTADEVAKDEMIRHAVKAEFPPALSAGCPNSLSEALRSAIRQSPQSADEIAEKAKVSPLIISRFMSGERDIHLETADRLAGVLGVKLTANTVSNA